MPEQPIFSLERRTGVITVLDIIFIALGAGAIAVLALYTSGLARI